MARPGVTESEVFEAIQTLIEMGTKVTVESVRAELGHGSPNTINRHLRAWRAKPLSVVPQSSIEVKQLKKKCMALEAELEVKGSQAEKLLALVLEREQKILELEKALQSKEQEQFSLVQSLAVAEQALEKWEAVKEAIQQERQEILKSITETQQQQIEQFREDLKAVNEMSLNQVREISMNAQDRWLAEKIKVRELVVEIAQLKSLNQALEEKMLGLQTGQAPLKKRIADQEKLIAHCLDPKKVEAFKGTEGNTQ